MHMLGLKSSITILFVQNTVFKIYMDLNPNICICIHFHTYVIDIKIKIYIYKLIWFRTGASKRVSRVIWFRTGIQSAFRESFGSERGFKARFASHLVQNGALQSAFRESFDSERGFKARFASHLVQNGALQSAFRESIWFSRVQIIWFSSGLQSANHLIKFGTSERRAQIIWFSSGLQSA